MTDTRAERPRRSPGGDPAGGPPLTTTADATRTTNRPRLWLVGESARGDARGRKPDLRVVVAGANGLPAMVHSTHREAHASGGPARASTEAADRRGLSRRSKETRSGRTEGLWLVGPRELERPPLRLLPGAPTALGRSASAPVAAWAAMRDDDGGADGEAAVSGGNPTLASLREALEMERPL